MINCPFLLFLLPAYIEFVHTATRKLAKQIHERKYDITKQNGRIFKNHTKLLLLLRQKTKNN